MGVESEAELAFAGLHQLLHPVLGLMELLPAPQRRALEVAFGIASGPEPDAFLVALAAYQLVCDAAEESPVVILVDDAHWLDRSTSGVLMFIARRLENEPVALLVSVRTGFATPLGDAGLPDTRARAVVAIRGGCAAWIGPRPISIRCFAPAFWLRRPVTRWRWWSWFAHRGPRTVRTGSSVMRL